MDPNYIRDIPVKCIICGKEFLTSVHNIKKGRISACSKACVAKTLHKRFKHLEAQNKNMRPKAKQLFRSALKYGKVNRHPCEICGSIEAHGHHDDYSEPLRVRWLCRKHHAEAHPFVGVDILER